MRQYVIGTAGHIDHGKTALVQALTGINTDRLKEEQERGITIDLGFAHLSENVTIIDVPGHERLIKNMVAGVSTIDLVLFVVAADDGIMPQTREHLDIVKLLGIRNGVFVITKIDLVEPEWVDLVEEELRGLLKGTDFEDAPILRTSTVKQTGIAELRQTIARLLEAVPERQDDGIFREPIDRVFTKAGFGTVITGSVLSGHLRVGQEVEILPEKLRARVRGMQTHDHPVEEVKAGYRAALNLAGVEHADLRRGQVITLPDYYEPVEIFNARLRVLMGTQIPVKNQMRVRVHIHTEEVIGRVLLPEKKVLNPGASDFVQIRLEKPIYAGFRDRFIIRQYSPQITLGGGTVLQTNPPKFRKKFLKQFIETCRALESDDPLQRIPVVFPTATVFPLSPRQIQLRAGLRTDEVDRYLNSLVEREELFPVQQGREMLYFSRRQLELIQQRIERILEQFHQENPALPGMRLQEMLSKLGDRFAGEAVQLAVKKGVAWERLKETNEIYSLRHFSVTISPRLQQELDRLEQIYRENAFTPPTTKEVVEQHGFSEKKFRELSSLLIQQGRLTYVEEKLYFHRDAVERAIATLRDFFTSHEAISVSQFRELLNTTRKFALPLLTWMDNHGYTLREGDVRVAGEKLKKT